MNFKTMQRKHCETWKLENICSSANPDDFYIKKYKDQFKRKYRHCIQRLQSHHNLRPEIREQALKYFQENQIVWHDGKTVPSNNLLDSQVSFLNFLEPLADKPQHLLSCIQTILPEAERVLPISENRFIDYEINGAENYLGEYTSKEGRIRGEFSTNADGLILVESSDGRKTGFLIEWKYTESYDSEEHRVARTGTDRYKTYKSLLLAEDSPFKFNSSAELMIYFENPLYQFMRLSLLAQEMTKAKEYGMDEFRVLLLSPSGNHDFHHTSNRVLHLINADIRDLYRSLLKDESSFLCETWESFFEPLLAANSQDLTEWRSYLEDRYFITDNSTVL